MHIILANQWFPPESGWGGVATYNWVMGHAFRDLGHLVTVVASRLDSEVPSEYENDGIRIHRILVRDPYRLRQLPILGHYVRPFQQLLYSRRVKHAIEQIHRMHPVNIVEFAEVNAEGFFYARSPRTPISVRCHTPTFVLKKYYGSGELPFDTQITSWCEKDLIRRADVLTTPSRDTANRVAEECRLTEDAIAVIPNALPLSEFVDAPSANSDADEVDILFVGRFEYAKGIGVLAQAIPRVLQAAPKARFTLLGYDRQMGEGVSKNNVEKQLAEFSKSGKVQIIGHVAQPEMSAWYQRADICVVPSVVYESFSYTCAQAMAAGKPVVATRLGGIVETVDDGVQGLIVEPGNVDQLSDAIVRLAHDRNLRSQLGHAGRVKVLREFDPCVVAKKNLAVYELAIARFKN